MLKSFEVELKLSFVGDTMVMVGAVTSAPTVVVVVVVVVVTDTDTAPPVQAPPIPPVVFNPPPPDIPVPPTAGPPDSDAGSADKKGINKKTDRTNVNMIVFFSIFFPHLRK